MKKALMVLLLGVVTFASSAMGLTFTEDFETGAGNQLNANWATPQGLSGYNARSSSSNLNHTPGGSYGFLVNNNYEAGKDYGASHVFEETLVATATDPVHFDYWLKAGDNNQHRNKGDWFVEISNGDVHAPEYGTVLTEAIPVIAFGKPQNGSTKTAFFDGKRWIDSGYVDAGGTWYHASVDVLSNGTATIAIGNYGPYTDVAIEYTGGFDRVSIISWGNHTAGGYWYSIDDLTVTGVPEPATAVMLLGLGGLFLRRRVR